VPIVIAYIQEGAWGCGDSGLLLWRCAEGGGGVGAGADFFGGSENADSFCGEEDYGAVLGGWDKVFARDV